MNGEDIKWLEKLFDQHKAEQQLYLDTRFNNLEDRIREIKDLSSSAVSGIAEREIQCAACKEELRKTTNKKVITGGIVTLVATIMVWTALGTDAAKLIIGIIGKLF